MKTKWQIIKERWLLLIFVLILIVLGIVFFSILRNDPNLAIATMAFGTLILAIVTAFSIDAADRRERNRIAEDNRVHQGEIERDFKRRCLNDIQDWADKGINVFVSWLVPIDQSEMKQIRSHLKPLSALNKWVMDASRTFAEDDKKALLKKVDEAAENLKQYCEVLEGKLSNEAMAQRHDQCLKSFTEVLERIADLKVKLRL